MVTYPRAKAVNYVKIPFPLLLAVPRYHQLRPCQFYPWTLQYYMLFTVYKCFPPTYSDIDFPLYPPMLHYIPTSSTAQGGGGSFKNRKPIGEVGCCESRVAERIHWWTERWLKSPLSLSPSFLSLTIYTYLPTCLSVCLPVCLCIYLPVYLSIYLSTYLSTYLLSTYLPTNLI